MDRGNRKMKKIEEFYNKNRPIISVMMLATVIAFADFDFTFGEASIISLCFYYYLSLQELILKLKEETEK